MSVAHKNGFHGTMHVIHVICAIRCRTFFKEAKLFVFLAYSCKNIIIMCMFVLKSFAAL